MESMTKELVESSSCLVADIQLQVVSEALQVFDVLAEQHLLALQLLNKQIIN
jgi:hypothetical protein